VKTDCRHGAAGFYWLPFREKTPMRVIGVIVAGLLALCVPARAALPAEQPYKIAFAGRLTTEVYIDGQGPFNFLIDTASSRSLIFEHVRKQLGLQQSQPDLLPVYGINDVGQAMPVTPGELKVAGESVKGILLGVLPDTVPGQDPDGVLGLDVLSRYFVVLDRTNMRLRLMAPGSQSASGYTDWYRVSLRARSLKKFSIQFWYLDAFFNGKTITSLFDLGSGATVLNWLAAEKLGVRQYDFRNVGPPPELLQDVLGKKKPAIKLYGLDVRLPGRLWRQQMALVADAPVFDYFDLEQKPAAIMGADLLGENSLGIDFAGQRLYIGPAAQDTLHPPA
jgi:predicted aspartyl protease